MRSVTTTAVVAAFLLSACSSEPPTWSLWEITETWNDPRRSDAGAVPDTHSATKREGRLDRLVCETLRDRAETDEEKRVEILHDLRLQAAALGIRRPPEPLKITRYTCKPEGE